MTTQITPALPLLKVRAQDWKSTLAEQLVTHGYVIREKPWGAIAWYESDIRRLDNTTDWVEAVEIRSSWLGRGKEYISVSNKRQYLDRERNIIREAEHLILGPLERPSVNQGELLNGIKRAADFIELDDSFEKVKNALQGQALPLFKMTSAVGANNCQYELQQDMWTSIARNGAFQIPESVEIVVVHDSELSEKTSMVAKYCDTIERKFWQVNRQSSSIKIHKTHLERILDSVQERIANPADTHFDNRVFLIAITGKKGMPLPSKQLEFLDCLDQLGYQYRLFSYDNKNLTYSASNQLISLIEGAGGVSYRLNLPYPESYENGVFFGVDLGHDAGRGRSNLVVSVVDQYGGYILSVRHCIKLNEAIDKSILVDILNHAKSASEEKLGHPIHRVIILRDGKIPEKRKASRFESIGDYLNALNCPTSVIEVRKRQNPPLYALSQAGQASQVFGYKFQAEGTDVQFFNAYASNFGIPNTFKVVIPNRGDTFGWGIDVFANIIAGLCYSPSLGMKPHLPGPIYWADGIAKTSETDNRFRGQYVIEHC